MLKEIKAKIVPDNWWAQAFSWLALKLLFMLGIG
jgi:hypothetical protein